MNRREFCRKLALAGGAAVLVGCMRTGEEAPAPILPSATPVLPSTDLPPTASQPPAASATAQPTAIPQPTVDPNVSRVAFVRTRDRADGVRRAVALLGFDQPGMNPIRGTDVLIKANFNSADPAPASTHPDVLRALVTELQSLGAGGLTLGERSGMGDTGAVLQATGVNDLAAEFGMGVVRYDDYADGQFAVINDADFHWSRGIAVPRLLLDAETVVQVCCLKTHRFGGHFTMSLKNSVGLVQEAIDSRAYNYMTELHNSAYQRTMIAEINTAYSPALIVMDGVDVFTDGGPDVGTLAQGDVVLAGSDRVALDAVGVALLRLLGTNSNVSAGRVFEQEQIARAAELGLGASSPDQIAFVTDDADSALYAEQVRAFLT